MTTKILPPRPDTNNADQRPIERLTDLLAYLYSHPDGCSWTRAQTHESLVPYLIEESYETAEVIDKGHHDAALRDELGDILLQVVYHAEIARARGAFDFDDIARAIGDKLVRRYPTILGDEPNTLKTPEEIDRRWNEIKAEERRLKGLPEKEESFLDGISTAMPALVRASKLKGRASQAGWEWPDTGMLIDKIAEEVRELKAELESESNNRDARIADEFGDLMFLMVDFARLHGIDAEDTLRRTTGRVESRLRHIEKSLKARGQTFESASMAERQIYWDEAKKMEKESR